MHADISHPETSRPERGWPSTLDVSALLADGWRPTPFREFVLKIHSRCDLACDYCYMYEMADQSWRRQPARMPRTVLDQAAGRIAEHVTAHRLDRVRVILHGGEPLLAGPELITYAVTGIRAAMPDGIQADLSILDGFRSGQCRDPRVRSCIRSCAPAPSKSAHDARRASAC